PAPAPVLAGAADTQTTNMEESDVPLAQLPQTGGLGSLAFLGMGALIAALGVGLKKRETVKLKKLKEN
ncbi:MAG: LPXTG cell wall anchor domain-containing protein, partial [Anaerovorax sp.]